MYAALDEKTRDTMTKTENELATITTADLATVTGGNPPPPPTPTTTAQPPPTPSNCPVPPGYLPTHQPTHQ
jgi:hypothetical protein